MRWTLVLLVLAGCSSPTEPRGPGIVVGIITEVPGQPGIYDVRYGDGSIRRYEPKPAPVIIVPAPDDNYRKDKPKEKVKEKK